MVLIGANKQRIPKGRTRSPLSNSLPRVWVSTRGRLWPLTHGWRDGLKWVPYLEPRIGVNCESTLFFIHVIGLTLSVGLSFQVYFVNLSSKQGSKYIFMGFGKGAATCVYNIFISKCMVPGVWLVSINTPNRGYNNIKAYSLTLL